MRAYGALLPEVDGRQSLQPLPNNPNPTSLAESRDLIEEGYAAAPKEKQRNFDVTAVAASALPGGLLVYNAPKLKTAQAVLYFQTEDLDFTGGKVALKKDRPLEPLILRAAAGDWIRVTLRNAIPSDDPAVRLPQTLPYGTPFSGNIDNPGALPQVNMLTSALVGLHPQLVAFNPIKANGVRVGFNKNYLLGPGPNPNPQPGMPPVGSDFYWYAGEVSLDSQGKVQGKPIEFDATNLTPTDPLLQAQFGMVGALIIEPEGATWRRADLTSRATVDVKAPNANVFREFVVIDQNMVANAPSKTAPFAPAQGKIGAINYRTEPRGLRIPSANVPASPQGYSQLFSNSVNNPPVDPQTPVFVAAAGTPVRFRLLVPSTSTSNAVAAPPVFIVSGHNFQQEPYIEDSTMIGFNPLSETHGAVRGGVGDKFDLLFQSAGGHGKVAGDYLYLTYQTAGVAGTWGLFRVTAANVRIENASIKGGSVQVNGSVEVVAQCGALPQKLQVTIATEVEGVSKLGSADVEADGKWSFKADTKLSGPALIQVQEIGSNGEVGATATVGVPAPASAKPAPLQVIEADLRSIPGGYHGATVSRRAAIQ
jgi:FtsP/CotA-like multicopper oxidase with cupredoxin domain